MAATDLDYYVWKYNALPGESNKWAWEVVRVDDEGEETTVDGGFEPTQDRAKRRAAECLRLQPK